MSNVTGIVNRMNSRQAGRGTVWSIEVNGTWYGGMWDQPNCNEGDNVEFVGEQNGQYWNVRKGSLKVVEGAAPAAQAQQGGGRASPTQTKIEWQAARNSAIALAQAAVAGGAIALPKTQAKAFDALVALVDDFTVRYYTDTANIEGAVERITGGADAVDYQPTIEE